MERKTKVIITIIIILILCIAGYLVHLYFNGNKEQNTTNNNTQSNVSTTNNVVENTVENNVVENNIQENNENKEDTNTEENNTTTNQNTNTQPEANTNSEVTSANEADKAIQIAKKAWGDTDGVYFSHEAIDANGNYIIRVSSNAKVVAWYTVNAKTGSYTVQYT